jgi:hypothetical protein
MFIEEYLELMCQKKVRLDHLSISQISLSVEMIGCYLNANPKGNPL